MSQEGVEMGIAVHEVVVEQIREHIHRAFSHFMHIDVHRGEGRANDIGVFGADKRKHFHLVGERKPQILGGVFYRRGDGVAIADEIALGVLFEEFFEVVVRMGIGIVAVHDVIGTAEFFMGLDEDLFAAGKQAARVMNVEEGHRLRAAMGIIIHDDLFQGDIVIETDGPDFVSFDSAIDDHSWNVIGSNPFDVIGIKLVVENNRPIHVGRDDSFDHLQSLVAAMGGGE